LTSSWRNATLAAPAPGQIVFDERRDGAWQRTGPQSARMTLKSARIRP
jgi:hypothetical protein